jgi:hypothetical protein
LPLHFTAVISELIPFHRSGRTEATFTVTQLPTSADACSRSSRPNSGAAAIGPKKMSFFDPVDPPDFAAAATAGTAVAAAAPPPWPTAEPDQLVEIQRDHAGELVPREVHPHEVPEPEQRRGQLTGEAVVLEVDRAELHQAGEVAVTISVVLAARFPAMGAVAVLPAELFSTGEIIQVALDSLSGDPTRSSRRTLG